MDLVSRDAEGFRSEARPRALVSRNKCSNAGHPSVCPRCGQTLSTRQDHPLWFQRLRHADSEVDILVITPCRNAIDQACNIDRAFDPPFPLDLIGRESRAGESRASVTVAVAPAETSDAEFRTKAQLLENSSPIASTEVE
jgi:hypothetical protein